MTREEVARRVELARDELRACRCCPRECGVDRLADESRVCHTGRNAIVSSAFAHFGEESCLSGTGGSGTIFFSGCNLRCVFCQNADISQARSGEELPGAQIAALMLALQEQGCHNINFVTPEHVVPQVVEAIAVAAAHGLSIPIVYNTSAYDSIRSLRLLDGLVDIYMPDFKFWSPDSGRHYCAARDYPDRAREAILEMHRQVGVLQLGASGLARRGVLIRHLVMPDHGEDARQILRWIARELSPDTWVNIMAQYRPAHRVGKRAPDGASRFAAIDRRPSSEELDAAFSAARDEGLWRFDRVWGRSFVFPTP
jgi:putative pyruvate formate lyase activating enzyme